MGIRKESDLTKVLHSYLVHTFVLLTVFIQSINVNNFSETSFELTVLPSME